MATYVAPIAVKQDRSLASDLFELRGESFLRPRAGNDTVLHGGDVWIIAKNIPSSVPVLVTPC